MSLQAQSITHSRWGDLAAYLLQTEKTASWRKTHASFSSWLAHLAQSLDRSEATLWRALAAGRYYNALRQASKKRGITLPVLGAPQLAASPEAIELVAKISRAAPTEVAQQITEKVVAGAISRRELRTYWETYRPVLDGRTARGRNVTAPRFNPSRIDMVSSRLEADCIAGLIHAGGAWLGVAEPRLYKVIPFRERMLPGLDVRSVPDVIVLYQRDLRQPLEVHGIEATARPGHNAVIRRYRASGLGVDYLWIVTPSDAQLQKEIRSNEIGLLEAKPNRVRVFRPAGNAKQNRDETANLLRSLLAREIVA
jgi:hypothetical protein